MADTRTKSDKPSKGKRPQQGKVAKEINEQIRYTTWSVFRSATPIGEADRSPLVAEVALTVTP